MELGSTPNSRPSPLQYAPPTLSHAHARTTTCSSAVRTIHTSLP
jgi:hypothetical protein